MELKKLIQQIKPPCPDCPYKQGLIHTLVNPCPACRENGYETFARVQKQLLGEALSGSGKDRMS
ncbi:MAG: hypothetical protein HFF18_02585 [Oscillospiraceae bacterium]|nr:hypothetical protein [Oscillospiraceae bacterium]